MSIYITDDTGKLYPLSGGTAAQCSNPNLLINGDFRVNQRGQTSYTGGNTYCVDRWYLQENTLTFDVTTKTLTNNGTTNAYMYQKSEDLSDMLGKDITISAKIDGVVYSRVITFPTTLPSSDMAIGNGFGFNKGVVYIYYYSGAKVFGYVLQLNAGQSIKLDYCKIEQGTIATPNILRPYAEELALCQRYYLNIKEMYNAMGVAYATGTSGASVNITTPVTMRTPKTISFNVLYAYRSGQTFEVSDMSGILGNPTNSIRVRVVATSDYTIGQVINLILTGTIDAEIY